MEEEGEEILHTTRNHGKSFGTPKKKKLGKHESKKFSKIFVGKANYLESAFIRIFWTLKLERPWKGILFKEMMLGGSTNTFDTHSESCVQCTGL